MSVYENRLLRLDFGEPSFLCPKEAKAEAIKYILNPDCYYAPIKGEKNLINKIANHFKNTRNLTVEENCISITTGGLMGLNSVIRALKKRGVKKIFYPNPGFPPYSFLGENNEIITKPYTMVETNETIEKLNEIAQNNLPKSVAFIITSPNNPNGLTFSSEEWNTINNFLKHQYIICDNSFESFIYDKDKNILPPFNDNYFHIFSFSKSYSLADYRVGYVVSPSEKWNESISREHWFTQLSTSVISQRAAIGALNAKREYCEMNKSSVLNNIIYSVEFLLNNGINVKLPDGGFFIWVDITSTGFSSEEFTNFALKHYMLSVISGDNFGTNGVGFVRINCATDKLSLKEGLNRFVSLFNERVLAIENSI